MTQLEARLFSRRKMLAAARISKRTASPLPPAWFLTDPDRTPDPLSIMSRLPRGWGVVYRHFGADNRVEVARAMLLVARRRGLILSVSYDEALQNLGMWGIHWPRWMLPKKRSLPAKGFQTSSAHDHRDVVVAEQSGIEACFTSSVFPSHSLSAPPAMGVHRYARLVRSSKVRLIALGGVTSDTATAVCRYSSFAAVGGLKEIFI